MTNIDEDKKFFLRDGMFWKGYWMYSNHMDTVHDNDLSECCTFDERHEWCLDDKCCREVLDKLYREAGIERYK